MLQFDAALNPSGVPGAFGWDHTPSIVPGPPVPDYSGSSPYLLMTKYNFYAGWAATGEQDRRARSGRVPGRRLDRAPRSCRK
jgi:hypothetical protein